MELTHMRVLLEGEGTVLSIHKGGVAWEARLTAAHHQLSHIEKRIHTTDVPADLVPIWFNAEREFHQTLISACGSETLKELHARVYAQFRQQLMVTRIASSISFLITFSITQKFLPWLCLEMKI